MENVTLGEVFEPPGPDEECSCCGEVCDAETTSALPRRGMREFTTVDPSGNHIRIGTST